MAGTEAAGSAFCVNCGTALQGKFCGACGSPAAAQPPPKQPSEGWGSLTSEFMGSAGRNGIFAVVLSFLRHPVDTIIRLTDDQTYRSQWKFLTAMVGAQLTLACVIVPRVYAGLFDVPNTADSSEVVRSEVIQYAGMAIMTPIQFYLCRWLGTLRRTPMSYVKLCVLSVSYGSILYVISTLGFFAATVAVLKSGAGFYIDLGELWRELSLVVMLAILVFVTASHRRFWGMSWPIATGVTLFIAALSWYVVYPGLGALISNGGIAGVLGGHAGGG